MVALDMVDQGPVSVLHNSIVPSHEVGGKITGERGCSVGQHKLDELNGQLL